MKILKRLALTLLAALCLAFPLIEAPALAEDILSSRDVQRDEELIEQIRDTYKKAKKSAHRKNFKGLCGKYVNRQLLVLGINTKYVGCNGNRAFDVYKNKAETTGGYKVTAYPAKKYKLKDALEAIVREDPHARNILVGFERGTSKAGKKYGHVLFIHGIEDGMVYFSENFARTVNGKRYKEGDPIVCSIATFVKLYRKYKLDGVIHFG